MCPFKTVSITEYNLSCDLEDGSIFLYNLVHWKIYLMGYITEELLVGIFCCSFTKSCLTLCNPMHCSMPGSFVLHYLPEFAQIHVLESVMLSNHLILCRPLLLLPSIFPSTRVFSSESALHIRWPKYRSFSISPSSEYSGLISLRIDWFDFLAAQRILKILLQHQN